MGGAGRIAGGVACLAIGWAGFELLAWCVVRRRELGHTILRGDPEVLAVLVFLAALSVLIFANGISRLRYGVRDWQRARTTDAEWHRRRIVFGAPVRTSIVVLAYIFFGGPALFFLAVAILHAPPIFFLGAFPLIATLLIVVGALTYWLLRRRRYGDSVCWLRTLPGVAGGRFEADVDCALPEGSEPTVVRLKNLEPRGKRFVEVWRMEERLAVPAQPGRTVVPVRLRVPRATEQRFMPPTPGFKEWLLGGGTWILEVEKQVPGIDFLARFAVHMIDLPDAPAFSAVPSPPDFGLPARPAVAPLLARLGAALEQAGPALALSAAVGTAWLGHKDGWLRTLQGPSAHWMEQESFQHELNFWSRHRSYPALIEMRCDGSNARYRADWKSLPPGAFYQAWSAMTSDDFARRDRDYRRSGYVLEMSGRFRTCRGEERISATWLKRR